MVARSFGFGDSEAIAKPIEALACDEKEIKFQCQQRLLCAIVSAEQFQHKGATTELICVELGQLRDFQGVEGLSL